MASTTWVTMPTVAESEHFAEAGPDVGIAQVHEELRQMEDDDGVNISALHALETRARRQRFRPATPDPE